MGGICTNLFCFRPQCVKTRRRYFKKNESCAKHELYFISPEEAAQDKDKLFFKCHICVSAHETKEGRYHCTTCEQDECEVCFKQTEDIAPVDEKPEKMEKMEKTGKNECEDKAVEKKCDPVAGALN